MALKTHKRCSTLFNKEIQIKLYQNIILTDVLKLKCFTADSLGKVTGKNMDWLLLLVRQNGTTSTGYLAITSNITYALDYESLLMFK